MIPAREVLALRDEWQMRSDVIEKDWALGWLIAGVAAHPALGSWVFKGGTCLRKCYYETYRFSEDLDFTVVGDEPLDCHSITVVFDEISEWLADHSGLELVVDDRSFAERRNRRGNPTVLGRLAYRGPTNPPTLPKIKVDLTNDEVLVEPAVMRPVFHPYSDALPGLDDIKASPYRTEIETEWANMLAHQLPSLPPFLQFWDALDGVFGWLHGEIALPALPRAELGSLDAEWRAPASMTTWRTGAPLELVRFAGANRLKVEIDYRAEQGRWGRRVVEPYALRRTREGRIVLFVVNDRGQLRSYRVDRIAGVSVSREPFVPRYYVEF